MAAQEDRSQRRRTIVRGRFEAELGERAWGAGAGIRRVPRTERAQCVFAHSSRTPSLVRVPLY
ncbi:unnamed protein product [[Actinomadura] parvosata subsp. kistnae]|nr:unnamed protein product [Actinomadura parvosata subsp. kistnae]